MAGRKRKLRGGSRTCGRGRKAGRGAGMRGGRGNAGLHKHRHKYMLKYDRDHYGMHGFKRPQSVVSENEVINVDRLLDLFAKGRTDTEVEAAIGKKGKRLFIDLAKLGYDKLLGNGQIERALHIRVAHASSSAIRKVRDAGGKVELID